MANIIPRVEGEMSIELDIDLDSKTIRNLKVKALEASRYFEVVMVGKSIRLIPLMASKICGICGYAHAIAAAKALENALGIELESGVEKLREVILKLSLLNSHIFHLAVMILADVYNTKTLLSIPRNEARKIVKLLSIKTKTVDQTLTLICGDRLHPKNIVAGGFTKLPERREIISKLEELEKLKKAFENTILQTLTSRVDEILKLADLKSHYVALKCREEYMLTKGNITVDSLMNIPETEFKKYFMEKTVPYSTSKICLLYGRESYIVGAISRINTNQDKIPSEYSDLAKKILIPNPYLNPIAQALEIPLVIETIISEASEIQVKTVKGKIEHKGLNRGVGVIEAPRGILYYEVEVHNGKLSKIDIITPTTQNIANMEFNIRHLVVRMLEQIECVKDKEKIRREVEKLVRCYDPCISCATHIAIVS